MANKIVYGLSNVHIWKIESVSTEGVPTYGTAMRIPGAVSLSVSAQGDSNAFYADDVVYYQTIANNGYEGTIEFADLPKEFLTEIMGEVENDNGTLFENSDVQPAEFAMAFSFRLDSSERRHLFFRVKPSRPDVSSSTKQQSIEPNTMTLNIACMAREDVHVVKARCEKGDADYETWFTTPVTPPAN